MRTQMHRRTPSMAIASAIMLHPNYSFGRSSSNSESNESSDQFDFSISKELILDPKDIMIGEMIGEGSYSVVYKGLFKKHIHVAVKIVQLCKTADVSIEHKEKFQNEVMLLSKIKHNNIVKFVGAIIEPKLIIVTELVQGGPLHKFMWDSRPSPLDLKMSLSFALDIAQAMEFLHSNGIIHRDLKPKNILITGDMKQVKLANFGFAREESTGCMTSEAGTYRYMAPEIFSPEPLKIGEKKHYDHKVDVYSFALVFWELLTNKTPFGELNYMSVPYFASKNKRPSLMNIPDGAVSILESCWAKNSNARPEFKEIIILLKNLLSSLCSESTNATTLSENQAYLDEINYSDTVFLLQNFNSQEMDLEDKKMKKKKSKKKKKKVLTRILPFFKTIKDFLSKSS